LLSGVVRPYKEQPRYGGFFPHSAAKLGRLALAAVSPIELLVVCEDDTMKTISELSSRTITPTKKHRREETAEILTCRIEAGNRTARHATYEAEVFNFLFDNKAALGIQS